MIGMVALMALGQTADWKPLPLTTQVPRLMYVCGFNDDTRPNYQGSWWQVLLLRDANNDRVKIYQVGGTGPDDPGVSLSNSLVAYDMKTEGEKNSWRLTYKSDANNLTLEIQQFKDFSTPPLHIVWKRDGKILDRHCWQTPDLGSEWWNRPETWK